MRAIKTGSNPSIYRIGVLPDGRNIYRVIMVDGPAYYASDELITSLDEGTWWTVGREEVHEWLAKKRFV
jgi:hypothetical protein